MGQPIRILLGFLIWWACCCATIAPLTAGASQPALLPPPARPVSRAPASITSGTLLSLPGRPVRVPLQAPVGFDHASRFWIPPVPPVSLVDHEALGLAADTVIAEVIGLTPLAMDTRLRASPWLGEPIAWQAVQSTDPSIASIRSPIYWMLFIRLPEELDDPAYRTLREGRDQAVTLDIGGERFPVRLAPQPQTLPFGRIEAIQASTSQWKSLGDQLAIEALDPARRWRVELLAERFTAQRLFGTDTLEDRSPITGAVLRGIASSFEWEWRSAIASVERLDPELAAQLLARLTCIVELPDGTLLPAWPTDGEAENSLLPQLLARRLDPTQRAERVRQYLAGQPATRVTVLDDAGSRLESREAHAQRIRGERDRILLSTVGASILVSDLSNSGGTLTMGPEGQFDALLVRVPASRSTIHRADATVTVEAGSIWNAQPGSLVVRQNQRESRLQLRVAPVPVSRPGQLLGPMLDQMSLSAWNVDGYALTPQNWQTAVLVYRDESSGVWKMYIEARFDPSINPTELERDRVEIHLGEYGQPDAVLVASPSLEAGAPTVSDDRWAAILNLPDSVLHLAQREGTLPIGVVRIDPRQSATGQPGISSWPRPLIPGFSEPGRFRLDLSAWDL